MSILAPGHIKLDQFLKFKQIAASGGQAKFLILQGEVQVNGVVESRRGRKLFPGDSVSIGGQEFIVAVKDVRIL